ncbi:MAG TPA: serine hydrolase domain-containing protein, partial [Polyangiaceae bacterium]|nr:serine hydrolase domain-containing protein [Polyangiaceae bacterium]
MTHRHPLLSSFELPQSGAPSCGRRTVGRSALAGLLLAVSPLTVACSGSDDSGPRELTPGRLAQFEKDLDAARDHLEVPGAAYAIISHGAVVAANGIGVRNLTTGEAVSTDTLFRVGALTKAMSSALVASRVDEGAVAWDSLAESIDPNFKLSDDALTVSVTLQELLGMATGIGSSPPFWWEYQTADDVIEATSTAAKAGARGSFVYNDEMFARGVYLGVGAGGETRPLLEAYSAELQARVFGPLEMSPAQVSDDPSQVGADFATSYTLSMVEQVNFKTEATPFAFGGLAPSGGVVTSVNEYAKFLIAEMQGGVGPNGGRIATEENLKKTQLAQVALPTGTLARYTMGWVRDRDAGRTVLWHDGSIDGYRSYAFFLPDDQIGLVVLTNGYNGDRLGAIARALLTNTLYGGSSFASTSFQAEYDSDKSALVASMTKIRPQFTTDPYVPYLGAYEHGLSLVQHDDETLWLEAPGVSGRLLDASALSAPGVLLVGNGQFVLNLLQFVGNGSG